ncbi:MAG: methylenetetrahydrofolate reductase [Acidimicrobiales bacterium]|nr:methylenetetrahydrofolate reductase [Acidimicrobiales bacterium]
MTKTVRSLDSAEMGSNQKSNNGRERKSIQLRLIDEMTYELIPLKNVHEQAEFLPQASTISITCSPAKDIEATLELCEKFLSKGHNTIPHFAARMVESEEHVTRIVKRIETLGIETVFIIGGDADQRGPFNDAPGLLNSFLDKNPTIKTIGIGSYPDGHPSIPPEALSEALIKKQEMIYESNLNGYMATQMCFETETISDWLENCRKSGVTLPCHLGVPGVVDMKKLINISLRLGVGISTRYLKKNRKSVFKLLSPRGYNPNKLIAPISSRADELNISGVHCFTFNAVDSTVDWRTKTISRLI